MTASNVIPFLKHGSLSKLPYPVWALSVFEDLKECFEKDNNPEAVRIIDDCIRQFEAAFDDWPSEPED